MEGKPEPATTEAYEHSEMLLYRAQVLLEGKSCAAAMTLLDAVKVGMQAVIASGLAVPAMAVVLMCAVPRAW